MSCQWKRGRRQSPAQAKHPGGILCAGSKLAGKKRSKETTLKSGGGRETEEEVQWEREGSQSSTWREEGQAEGR